MSKHFGMANTKFLFRDCCLATLFTAAFKQGAMMTPEDIPSQ